MGAQGYPLYAHTSDPTSTTPPKICFSVLYSMKAEKTLELRLKPHSGEIFLKTLKNPLNCD